MKTEPVETCFKNEESLAKIDIKSLMKIPETKPNLFKDYDCIGFDADVSLISYNVKEMSKLVIECHLQDLHSHVEGYKHPDLADFDHDKYSGLCFENAVWDL
jgi:hypothetical protein